MPVILFQFKAPSFRLGYSSSSGPCRALRVSSRIEYYITNKRKPISTPRGHMCSVGQFPSYRRFVVICISLHLLSSYLINLLFAFSRPMKPKTLLLDTLVSGTILYYMIGLADRESFSNFVIYSVVLFVFATLMNQQMALFASFGTNAQVQVYGACTLFFAILFSGFIIPLDTIPNYFSWIYWLNPFAWAYNALILNEVYSGRWSNPDAILIANGFVKSDGSVLDAAYIGWGVLYMTIYWIVCCICTALGLTYATDSNGAGAVLEKIVDSGDVQETNQDQSIIVIPFKPLTLSFQNLCYEVTASTSKEKLMLLKNVNGIFHPGRMCALMGSSGAGYVFRSLTAARYLSQRFFKANLLLIFNNVV
jgi:ABC-type multidrug transport system fused ATPase/permease subunit